MLVAKDLTIGYRIPRAAPFVVANGLNVALKAGELVCLVGPNGAGKSTLLRTLAGMQAPLSGTVMLTNHDLHALPAAQRAKHLSVVLTEPVRTGLLSAYALVGLGRYPHTNWSGTLTTHDHQIIQWAIEAVGAEALAQRNLRDLSDGERQKIMIARALAQEPNLMILDEITAFLDVPRRVEIMQLLRRLTRQTDRAIILSTHDLDLALRSADRIWLLPKGGPLQIGAPEDLVLSGAFSTAFASEGVHFDQAEGTFHIHPETKHPITLIGEGLERYWTMRALEREGFEIQTNTPHDLRIEIHIKTDERQWHIYDQDAVHICHSLYEMIQHMRLLHLVPNEKS